MGETSPTRNKQCYWLGQGRTVISVVAVLSFPRISLARKRKFVIGTVPLSRSFKYPIQIPCVNSSDVTSVLVPSLDHSTSTFERCHNEIKGIFGPKDVQTVLLSMNTYICRLRSKQGIYTKGWWLDLHKIELFW